VFKEVAYGELGEELLSHGMENFGEIELARVR
jgi:hypothetical protein